MIRDVLALIGLATVLAVLAMLVIGVVDDFRRLPDRTDCLRCGRYRRAPWRWPLRIWMRWHRRRGGTCARSWPAEKARRADL